MVLRGWQRFHPTSVRLKIFNSFMDFSGTEILALAGVDLSPSDEKETEVKLGRPL